MHAVSEPLSPSLYGTALEALYFDGRQAQARPVRLTVDAQGLHLHPVAVTTEAVLGLPGPWAADTLDWPEPRRHGPRVMLLPDGGQLHCHDPQAWDRWVAAHRAHMAPLSRVVVWQQSWRHTALAFGGLVLVLVALYLWGLPWLSRGLVQMVPPAVDRRVGEHLLSELDRSWLQPSALPAATREHLQQQLTRALARHAQQSGQASPEWQLLFRRSRSRDRDPSTQTPPTSRTSQTAQSDPASEPTQDALGPNAFALPGGMVIVTDAMVALLADSDEALLGVMAHELGHVRHRHGMRMLVQGSLLAVGTGLLFGDVSGVVGMAPLLLGQSAYSRDVERQADDEAIAVMQSNQVDPAAMALLFERLARAGTPDTTWGIALSSHPADEERVARFRSAGR